ncbi:MAG: 2'-5' RNA ligase family protein [Bacteroidota bacterium]|nr:2'-5' RNA ligase family protein [Bacteroidota bacterium]
METVSVSGRTISQGSDSLYAYSLVVQTPEKVTQWVKEERNRFAETYATVPVQDKKPGIRVVGFTAMEEMEATLFRWIHRIISVQKKFRVNLEKYNGFPSHTIYLQVRDHRPFQELAREMQILDPYIKSYGCPSVQAEIRPHLVIAEALSEPVYRSAEKEYAQKRFDTSFDVNELVLLRRQHAFDQGKQVSVFGLQP